MNCIACKSEVQETGLLSRCLNSDCGAVRWDKPQIRSLMIEQPELEEQSNPAILQSRYLLMKRMPFFFMS